MNLEMEPYILLSIVNMKLRDFYSNLEDLCEDLNVDKSKLEQNLNNIGYIYSSNNNQFIIY